MKKNVRYRVNAATVYRQVVTEMGVVWQCQAELVWGERKQTVRTVEMIDY